MLFRSLKDIDAPSPAVGDGIEWNGTTWVKVPLVGSDEKVKADADDPTAGFLDGKVDGATLEVDVTTHKTRVKDKGISYAKIQDVSVTDKLLGRQTAGAGPAEEIDCTGAGRALIDDENASAQRATLELGSGNSPTFTGLTLSGIFKGHKHQVVNHIGGSADPLSIVVADSNKIFENDGATALTYFTLPTPSAGLVYTFYVLDSDGIRVDCAAAGQYIRIAGNISTSGGNIQSTTVGSCVILIAISSTLWVAISVVGSWSVSV